MVDLEAQFRASIYALGRRITPQVVDAAIKEAFFNPKIDIFGRRETDSAYTTLANTLDRKYVTSCFPRKISPLALVREISTFSAPSLWVDMVDPAGVLRANELVNPEYLIEDGSERSFWAKDSGDPLIEDLKMIVFKVPSRQQAIATTSGLAIGLGTGGNTIFFNFALECLAFAAAMGTDFEGCLHPDLFALRRNIANTGLAAADYFKTPSRDATQVVDRFQELFVPGEQGTLAMKFIHDNRALYHIYPNRQTHPEDQERGEVTCPVPDFGETLIGGYGRLLLVDGYRQALISRITVYD